MSNRNISVILQKKFTDYDYIKNNLDKTDFSNYIVYCNDNELLKKYFDNLDSKPKKIHYLKPDFKVNGKKAFLELMKSLVKASHIVMLIYNNKFDTHIKYAKDSAEYIDKILIEYNPHLDKQASLFDE